MWSRCELVNLALQAYVKYPEFIGPILRKAAGPMPRRLRKKYTYVKPRDVVTPVKERPVEHEPRTFWCMMRHRWVVETAEISTRCPTCGRVSVGSATEMPEVTQGDVLALLRLAPAHRKKRIVEKVEMVKGKRR